MTTKSLLDVLDETSSPIWKAQAAVREDSVAKLRPLLEDPDNPVTEETYVNPQAKENLLHFAVHQSAAYCVALLVNEPFNWDPDRPNLIGLSPFNLSESSMYLPVWYSLAVHTKVSINPGKHFSIPTILTHPSIYDGLELSSYDIVVPMDPKSIGGPLVDMRTKFGDMDQSLIAINLTLLFELLLATPGIQLQGIELSNLIGQLPQYGGENHVVNCCNYPSCLFENPQEHIVHYFEFILEIWKFHRLCLETDEVETVVSSSSLPGPLSLKSWCRIAFRRHAVFVLNSRKTVSLNSQTDDSVKSFASNYASLVTRLPVTPWIQSYLSYRELWPVQNRHLVPRQAKRSRNLMPYSGNIVYDRDMIFIQQ